MVAVINVEFKGGQGSLSPYTIYQMRFDVEPKIFEMFPGLRLAVTVAFDLNTDAVPPALADNWQRAWTAAPDALADYPDRQSHPRIKAWRHAWKQIGVSSKKFPSSVESLLKRALKGGEPFSIHPIVDFYNTVSLEHLAPAGAFDLAGTPEGIALRLTQPGDTFQALDQNAPEPTPEGETAYATGSTVLTRHFVWKQSQEALVAPTTRDVFLVSEILGDLPDGVAPAIVRDFEEGLRTWFGTEGRSFIVDAGNNAVEWERIHRGDTEAQSSGA